MASIHYRLVQLLLDSGANVNAADLNGRTALLNAADDGDVETVQLLLSRGARVSATAHGKTALYRAAKGGHARIVQLLLDAGADAEVSHETPSASPIFLAAAGGHVEAVQLLLRKGGGSRQEVAVAAAEAAVRSRHTGVWSVLISHVRRYFPRAIGECVGYLSARDVAVFLGAAWSADLVSLDQQVKEAQQLKASGQQLLVQVALKHKQVERLTDPCRAKDTAAAPVTSAAAAAETATGECLALPDTDGHAGTSSDPSSTSSSNRGTTTAGSSSSTHGSSGEQGASSGAGCAGNVGSAGSSSSTHGNSEKQGASSGAGTITTVSSSPSSNSASALSHQGGNRNLYRTSSCSNQMGGDTSTSGKSSSSVQGLQVATAAAHLPLPAGEAPALETALQAAAEEAPFRAAVGPSTASCSCTHTSTFQEDKDQYHDGP